MALFMIGIGLGNEKDISVRGLEMVKKADKVYLEYYTSLLQCNFHDLAKFYGKQIELANREMMEDKGDSIVEEAKKSDVAVIIIGDVFSATTHMDLFLRAKKQGVEVEVVNNASVLTAVGITGLELYKFGKTTSIPFPSPGFYPETPYNVLRENQSLGLHTLFLLDLKPEKQKFMTVNEALDYLLDIEKSNKAGLIDDNTFVVGCARLGSNFKIKAGKVKDILKADFGPAPHCLIIPGKLHFVEEEALEFWK
jgi:diphthine synthase